MSDVYLGGGTYTAGQGGGGVDGAIDTSQLQPGDTARLELVFPFAIDFLPGEAAAALLAPVFAARGQTLIGVDLSGNTLALTWVVG